MTTAISNGETGFSVRTKINGIWEGLELNAIAESKAVTAVDVFVYDTSKDSDGGAWRKRTQHTSWYNETLNTATRGARREFPAVAVIVAESNKVTIYDGDDPSLPMWMVFNNGSNNLIGNSSISGVTVVNGYMALSLETGGWGVCEVRFVADNGNHRWTNGILTYLGSIAERNDGNGRSSASGAADGIVNLYTNDVAMTVLPDAPIDPATGLQVPTIAVATDGGVSVIKDDGTVVDLTRLTDPMGVVSFNEDGVLIFTNGSAPSTGARAWYYKPDQLTSDISLNIAVQSFVRPSTSDITDGTTPYLGDWYNGGEVVVSGNEAVGAPNNGGKLYRSHLSDFVDNPNHMANVTTSTYNTGWMNGDIKGAFLSDTDDTDLVGSGELVTNGTFDTDLTGWTQTGNDASNYWEWASNAARCVSAGSFVPLSQACLTTGKRYVLTLDVTVVSGGLKIGSINTAAYNDVAVNISASGTYTYTFTALSDTLYFGRYSGVTDVSIDNISVKLADADRSVNNKGLIVNGTVTRTAVATGADLVAYSGFSASNYLEQPYNASLDFGTGDFCVMGWVYGGSANTVILDRASAAADHRFSLSRNGSNQAQIYLKDGATAGGVVSTTVLGSRWSFICARRLSGIVELFVDGKSEASSGSFSGVDITADAQTLVVGAKYDKTEAWAGSLALLRISATAPTAEQVAKIYNDEKVLFQENAQATLYGSSDAVTALAHDSDTGILSVGTSAGRSDFQGLRRVSNTTTAVGTAISASNGLVVEE